MSTCPFRLRSLIIAAPLLGLASPAIAAPKPSLNVAIHLCDDDGIQPSLVSRAQVEMSRIYEDAGVKIAWTPDAVLTSTYPLLTLVVLCRELTDELTVDTTALGAAAARATTGVE